MMLAAPEFIVAERVDLLDEIEVPAELQHRMLADRVMRCEEGSEFQACHGCFSGRNILVDGAARQATGWNAPRQSRKALYAIGHGAMRAADGSGGRLAMEIEEVRLAGTACSGIENQVPVPGCGRAGILAHIFSSGPSARSGCRLPFHRQA